MAKDFYPGPEKVATTFFRTLPGLPSAKIATSLPEDATSWRDTGFIQIQVTGGSPDRVLPMNGPVITVDVWANTPGSKAPWGQAEALAQSVKQAIFNIPLYYNSSLDMGANFHDVTIMSAWTLTEPRRVENDDSGYARYTMDIEMRWSTK